MEKFKPKSFHFQWHTTERCNLHCKHCYIDKKFIKEETSTKGLFIILDKYIKQMNEWGLDRDRTRITFMGGEPLIRKDFFDLLQKVYNNPSISNFGLSTNGTLIDKDIVSKLSSLNTNYVQVSLEGREKINDEIRGKGVFKKAINSLNLFKKAGITTSISMTVSKMNIKEVPYLIKLSQELNINSLGIRRFIPIGGAKELKKFLLSPQEIKKLYLFISDTVKKTGMRIGLGCEDGILAQERHYLPSSCSAGYLSFTVLPNGDIYPCRRMPIYSGNLLKQSFSDIYYNSEELKKIRNINNIADVCQSCPYFIECRGGAMCMRYAYFGSISAPDPQCWRLFEKLPESHWIKKISSKETRLNKRMVEI